MERKQDKVSLAIKFALIGLFIVPLTIFVLSIKLCSPLLDRLIIAKRKRKFHA